jgi:hypothetical protein
MYINFLRRPCLKETQAIASDLLSEYRRIGFNLRIDMELIWPRWMGLFCLVAFGIQSSMSFLTAMRGMILTQIRKNYTTFKIYNRYRIRYIVIE